MIRKRRSKINLKTNKMTSEEEETEIVDTIYADEIDYLNSYKENNQYVIGIGMIIKNGIFIAGISNTSFFKYNLKDIILYLHVYSIIFIKKPILNIFQLAIINDVYIAIKKTYWISICQRHWRKIYKEKKDIFLKRKKISSLIHFERYGCYPDKIKYLPSIRGMLHFYTNKKN